MATPPPPAPTDNDPPAVAAEVTNPANASAIQQAAHKLTDKVAALTPRINALADNAVITLKDGSTINGEELKALWNRADFVVTDRTNFGMDRGGSVVGMQSNMHFSTVEGYDLHVDGLDFIILHEIMHMTTQGKEYNVLMWEIHVQEGDTLADFNGSSQWFRSGEVFINAAARSILQQFPAGSDINPNATDSNPANWMPPWGLN